MEIIEKGMRVYRAETGKKITKAEIASILYPEAKSPASKFTIRFSKGVGELYVWELVKVAEVLNLPITYFL